MNHKIAFVIVRYGKDINGGAELHCRMLAERLKDNYQVEVLTTCVKNYRTGINELPEGTEIINGITVHRFKVASEPSRHFQRRRTRMLRKLRGLLCKWRLLKYISNYIPQWTLWENSGLAIMRQNLFYSPDLFNYIKEHREEYDVFIAFTLEFPLTFFSVLYAPERTIIVPLLHNDVHSLSFSGLATYTMTKAAYIAFNTTAEEKLGEELFGPKMSPHGIVSVSFEKALPVEWKTIQSKYHLPAHYLLYMGRIDKQKMTKLFENFISYKDKYPESPLKLVLIGGVYMKKIDNPNIIYTGFVSEEEKRAILQHADITINPSVYESLSLILLESLYEKKPMLVNGHCNVLEEHAEKSDGGALAYYSKKDFIHKLYELENSEELRNSIGEKGFRYVCQNYNWDIIMNRLTNCIENVIKVNNKIK